MLFEGKKYEQSVYEYIQGKCQSSRHLTSHYDGDEFYVFDAGAQRMAKSATLLVDDVLPHEPISQWALSFPFQLRFLCASYPQIMGKVLGIVYRTLATHITKKLGYNKQTTQTGAVTLIQRFGSAGGGRAGRPKSFKYPLSRSTSLCFTPLWKPLAV